MIVRVTFDDSHIMLFGNSYKPWDMQFREYVSRFRKELPMRAKRVETSKSKWIAWGGLKWCSHEEFQNELNREGVTADSPVNPNPRQYMDMGFRSNPKLFTTVNGILSRYVGSVEPHKTNVSHVNV